jgi:hypothetical protein
MLNASRRSILALVAIAALAAPALAGMPALLPDDLPTRLKLHDSAVQRLTAISFFLGGVFVCSLAVCLLWNYLQRDFTWLPRLTVFKSLALVVLWGLLFVIVLTMISGARELMTPGAWRKQGFTYKLAEPPADERPVEDEPDGDLAARRQRLIEIRTALWLWAGAHDGQLPAALEETGSETQDLIYIPGQSLSSLGETLVMEGEIAGPTRLALRTDGEIIELAARDVKELDSEPPP